MDEIRDKSYYPAPFSGFTVTSEDDNGNPLITKWYSDPEKTKEIFKWTQTWNSNDKCTGWKVEIKGKDY